MNHQPNKQLLVSDLPEAHYCRWKSLLWSQGGVESTSLDCWYPRGSLVRGQHVVVIGLVPPVHNGPSHWCQSAQDLQFVGKLKPTQRWQCDVGWD
ncbi:hypothetical protein E2C01_010686 [Portunus trituberculatus]|uniref:Uncharacterized protein n=1 Tax=Portunus trituberculatus TaxID=210409 RepID=A0A5B7D939_PORTR|nr:hypothetical protein [Portunus trituberculatus]